MPLPLDANMSLQGYSKPGDTQCSQPKSAMIFRLSTDAMNRLADPVQSHKVSVVFGDKPVRVLSTARRALCFCPHLSFAACR